MKKLNYIVVASVLVAGCFFKGGSDFTVSGNLISTTPQTSIQGSPEPSITVVGQTVNGFSAKFTNSGFGSTKVGVTLQGLTENQTYIFEVAQNGLLDPIVSFPFKAAAGKGIDLAAVPKGTIQTIIDTAQAASVTVNSNKGMIVGQLSSNGTGCSPIQTVSITTSGSASGIAGPYYFDNSGNLVTSKFSDNECNYVFFNLSQGNYTLTFDSQFSTHVSETNVTVFDAKVSFGLNVP